MAALIGVAVALAMAGPASAETDFTRLTPDEQIRLGGEIRAVLLAHPDLIAQARQAPPPPDLYAEEVAGDLTLIADHAAALFSASGDRRIGRFEGPADMAVFIDDGESSAATLEQLHGLTEADPTLGIAIKRDEDLADRLGFDLFPSFVLPEMLIRGDIPVIVLERYLAERGR